MTATSPPCPPVAASRIPLGIAFLASAAMVSGVNLAYPALPVIATDLQVAEAQIGMVIAAFTMPAVVLAPLFGIVADSHGRRPLLIFGLLVFAAAGLAAAAAPTFGWLLVWRAVQGIGMSALSPLTIVLLSDLSPTRDAELSAQGMKVAIDRVAMIGLPILAGVLAVYSWRLAFLPFALVFIVAAVAAAYMPETRQPGRFQIGRYVGDIVTAVKEPRVSVAFAVGFFRFFIDYGFAIYLPLFLHLRFGTSVVVSGILLAISSAGAIVTAMTVRRLSRFASIELLLALAFAGTAAAVAVLLAYPPIWIVAIATFVIGLGNGIISPLQKSMITRNSPAHLRGGVISCDRFVQQIAKSLSPSLLGVMLIVAPMEAVFVTLVVVSAAGAVVMIIADRMERRLQAPVET